MSRRSMTPVNGASRFLVVLCEVRPLGTDGGRRNEVRRPERRRRTVSAETADAAAVLANAFASLGMVRAGRQRVKVLAVGRWSVPAPDPGRGVCGGVVG